MQNDSVNDEQTAYFTDSTFRKVNFSIMSVVPTNYTNVLIPYCGNSAVSITERFDALLNVKRPGAPKMVTFIVAVISFRPSRKKNPVLLYSLRRARRPPSRVNTGNILFQNARPLNLESPSVLPRRLV